MMHKNNGLAGLIQERLLVMSRVLIDY